MWRTCRQGKYEEARPTLESGLAMAEALFGAMAPETVTWMVQAMRVYTHLRQYRPALMLARRAVDVCEGGHTKAARLRLGCALNNLVRTSCVWGLSLCASFSEREAAEAPDGAKPSRRRRGCSALGVHVITAMWAYHSPHTRGGGCSVAGQTHAQC